MVERTQDITQLGAGITQEMLVDGRIVVFTLSDMTRSTVDLWVDACFEVLKTCAGAQRDILVLQDLSNPNASQTAYSKVRGGEVTHAYPEVKGWIAFVLPETLGSYRTRRFVEAQPDESRRRVIFADREEAIAWLMEQLED